MTGVAKGGVVGVAAFHEPDAVDRHVALVGKPMRQDRVDGDGIAHFQHVVVKADGHMERATQDVAPLLAGVALEGVLGTGRAAYLIDDVQELDPWLGGRGQLLPT